jgi:hypothetical protein
VRCAVQLGDKGSEPHAKRKILANEVTEQRSIERHLANLKEWTDELYRSNKLEQMMSLIGRVDSEYAYALLESQFPFRHLSRYA